MPVELLTDEQAARYGRFIEAPAHADLDRWCFLDDADRELVARRRGDVSRLGFALQLVTVRSLGTFLIDPLDVPTAVLDFARALVTQEAGGSLAEEPLVCPTCVPLAVDGPTVGAVPAGSPVAVVWLP